MERSGFAFSLRNAVAVAGLWGAGERLHMPLLKYKQLWEMPFSCKCCMEVINNLEVH